MGRLQPDRLRWAQASLVFLLVGSQAASSAANPRFHAVTYSNLADSRLSFTMGTADLHGFSPVVLGFGYEAAWAYGLSGMANLVRDYIFNRTDPEDVVLFFDAYDVIFQGGETEIMSRYLQLEKKLGRELIYHAEKKCTHEARQSDYPTFDSPWRFLNCGLYIGRSRALRDLYKEPVPQPLVDKQGQPMRLQNWHTDYYLDNQDRAALDTGCELMQVVDNIDGLQSEGFFPEEVGLKVIDGRLRNTLTDTVPAILHFPGSGHWPDWDHPLRTGTCPAWEFFRSAGHPSLAALMEKRADHNKFFFGSKPWKVLCTEQMTFFDTLAMQLSRFGDSVNWLEHNATGWHKMTLMSIISMLAFVVFQKCRSCRKRWELPIGKDH